MKRIYINGRFLTQPVTGVQRFALEICRELILQKCDIQLLVPKSTKVIDNDLKAHTVVVGNKNSKLWEQLDLPAFLKKKGSPLLINLCNSAPLNYKNNIITIHDLAFIENPKWFSYSFRKWYNFLIPRIALNAKHIFTVSEFSKTEIQNKLGINNKNITVLYNGLSNNLINHKSKPSEKNTAKKAILTVGSINPRKNIKPLIEAFNLLNLKDYELLVVGGTDANFSKENLNTKNESIKFMGYLPDSELWELYKKANLFVYPSMYEGFGIPVLEALYFDCPVLVNDLPVFKELYPTFELAVTNGNETKNYINSITEILRTEQNSKFKNNVLFSYKRSALKMNEIIHKYQ